MTKIIADFAWPTLLEKLQSPRPESALVLGEGAFTTPNGGFLHDALRTELAKTELAGALPTNHQQEFFNLPESERTNFCSALRAFYAARPPGDMLQQLAQIPFPLVINTTPHRQFDKAFAGLGATPQAHFYNRSEAPAGKIQSPTAKTPLLYNLVGTIEDDNSLVLTYGNLFDYFEAIFHERPLPDELRFALKSVKYFVFVGVPFERWYFHLLLRILGIHNFHTANRHAAAGNTDDATIDFVGDLFQIRFVRKNVGEFVGALHAHCDSAGLLRAAGVATGPALATAARHLDNNELEDAVGVMQTFLQQKNDRHFLDLLTLMAGNFRRTRRMFDCQLLTPEAYVAELDHSKTALGNLLRDIRQSHPES